MNDLPSNRKTTLGALVARVVPYAAESAIPGSINFGIGDAEMLFYASSVVSPQQCRDLARLLSDAADEAEQNADVAGAKRPHGPLALCLTEQLTYEVRRGGAALAVFPGDHVGLREARLVAAAPELLEACRALLDLVENWHPLKGMPASCEQAGMARKAVLKAVRGDQ